MESITSQKEKPLCVQDRALTTHALSFPHPIPLLRRTLPPHISIHLWLITVILYSWFTSLETSVNHFEPLCKQ